MVRALVILIGGLSAGLLFDLLNVPAGWLLGSLLFGIFYGLFGTGLSYDGWPFKLALTLVGTNIGLLMDRELFNVLGLYFFPLLISLLLTFAGSLFLGWLLYRWAPELDKKTAFFCCIPGGASEIISVSGEYGADRRIVAAFHTARITFFVLLIPLAAGFGREAEALPHAAGNILPTIEQLFVFVIVITAALLLNSRLKIPAGALLYSILFGFILGEFVFYVEEVPSYIGGIGQGLIGVMVGVRFDKSTFLRLRAVGFISARIIFLFLVMGFLLALVFALLSGAPYAVSLLSIVPAGAAEMAATAFGLGLEPTLVASIQILRVICIFLALPFLLKFIQKIG
ncbi:AbrB family transcriptional regulator [Alkalicoccus saliphilus]|jgi:uncharacterized protein|uniref:Ammonia monooxygenase n=1 Tax=Alkalicoccus saliphilus TaxID=200989 RepID=A0A2T4U954_9BACI|nr:AbrB family transcriptional regulator [Alkalicoccus saliphilus]PTL39928.1 hypothetical protein C6Y45_02800 [Alkalicoccus saliphilus]